MPRPVVKDRPARPEPKPAWLKVTLPRGEAFREVRQVLARLRLHTVCQEALCPNLGECWGGKTATVMIMGEICTRGCRFCAVTTGRPLPLDPDEPRRVAEAARTLGWTYVVLTSVDRDDLPDGGAAHFAATIRALRSLSPNTLVEALIPDFQGDRRALKTVVDAAPHVLAHNLETVRRLTPTVRDRRATYDQSLAVLRAAKEMDGRILTKSSLMLGLGETREEVLQAMEDLRAVGVSILTLGQYLQPTPKHLPVVRYIPPEEFDAYAEIGREMGFLYVAAGPLVRSSYRAGEFFVEAMLRAGPNRPFRDAGEGRER